MRIRKRNKIPFRPIIQIFCDGLTEKNYSDSLRIERYDKVHINIDPKLLKSSGYIGMMKDAEALLKDKSIDKPEHIYLVLDMDTIYSKGKYRDYQQRKEKMQKRWRNILSFIESRPCFEFWLLLHYRNSDRLYKCYNDLKPELRSYLPDYCKKNDYASCIYSKTKDNIQTAIHNAKTIMNKPRVADEEYSYTTFYELIERIDALLNI